MKTLVLELDTLAKSLAKEYLKTESKLLDLLMQMKREKVFIELKYTGIFDYCERALKLSRAQSYYFKSVAEKSEEVPELKIGITAETEAHLKRLQEIYSQKKQRFVSLAEVIALIAEETIEKSAPEKKLKRIRPSKIISSRKFSKDKPLLPKRVPIPQRIKLQKLNEAQNQCSFTSLDGKRCPQRLWLELHHKKPVFFGGGNEKENLIYLCSSHHRNLHKAGQS